MLLYEPFGVAIRSTLLSIVSYTFHRPDKRNVTLCLTLYHVGSTIIRSWYNSSG